MKCLRGSIQTLKCCPEWDHALHIKYKQHLPLIINNKHEIMVVENSFICKVLSSLPGCKGWICTISNNMFQYEILIIRIFLYNTGLQLSNSLYMAYAYARQMILNISHTHPVSKNKYYKAPIKHQVVHTTSMQNSEPFAWLKSIREIMSIKVWF